MRLIAHIAFALFASCAVKERSLPEPRRGIWRMELDLNGPMLPFNFSLQKTAVGQWIMVVHNGSENITVSDIALRQDSLLMRMPLFDSEFRGVVKSDSLIEGRWFNYLKGPEYSIAFRATAGDSTRFAERTNVSAQSVSGIWETHFSGGAPEAYNAVGVFESGDGNKVSGTFMTETGDYRFLQGSLIGDSLYLSCFDGSHAFLFRAALRGDSLHGTYWSGVHWKEPWCARRNAAYTLRDPDSLTTLREGYDMIDFRFQDLNGSWVTPRDSTFLGKPLMVQVMGSWCPNCVDETRLLNEVYAKYRNRGLGVIAIAFEKYDDPARAIGGLKRFQQTLGIQYPLLYGGNASKDEAGAKLPFLDHLMSYPTCIFIDRGGVVRRIRTGFYGPGTGGHYDHYKQNLDSFIEQLLADATPSKVL